MDPDQRIQPFAFLTHTHGKGVHASGWVVRDNSTWFPIGMRNPQVRKFFNDSQSLQMSFVIGMDINFMWPDKDVK